jgi:cutinase
MELNELCKLRRPEYIHYPLHSITRLYHLPTIIMKASFVAALAAITTLTSAAPAFDISELQGSDLTPEAHLLAKRQFTGSTYNQLTDGTACRAVTVIWARGTNQAGNVGDAAAVGPLFFNNLATKLGGTSKLAIQGVTYSASVLGFLQGGDPAGITTMTSLIAQAATKCPSTKIVVSGYSQGAQLVHSALQKTTAANAAKVAAGKDNPSLASKL